MSKVLDSQLYFSNKKSGSEQVIFLSILTLYLLFIPFYFYNSGLPQPSDLLMALLIFLIFLRSRLTFDRSVKLFLNVNLLFVFYITIVDLVWTIILGKAFDLLLPPLWYIFNFMVLICITISIRYNITTIRVIYNTIGLLLLFQLLMFILGISKNSGLRESLFFNNPNQLGYYSILSLAIILIIYSVQKKGLALLALSAFSSLVLAAASLSKAAFLSVLLMLFFFGLTQIKSKNFIKKGLLILIVVGLIWSIKSSFSIDVYNNVPLVGNLVDRLSTIGQSDDDTLPERGYDRIINDPQYLILGAGEGGFSRFDTVVKNHEIHSTLGNIFFSYGLIGLILFLTMIYQLFKLNSWQSFYPLIAVLFYGLTHNGIRNTLFWVLLAILLNLRVAGSIENGKRINTNRSL